MLEARAAYGAKFGPAKDAPVELTKIGDTFVRFSAFEQDKRINADGSLKPGTYATTETDAAQVHTGKQAVMRYALPNPDPAVNRFFLKPPEPTQIQFGIAEPAYGQPGGGVEVVFRAGASGRIFVRQDKIPLG